MADTAALSAINEQLANLREQGGHRYAPARFRYLEAQTERLGQLARVSATALTRLSAALECFQEDFQREGACVDAQLTEHDLADTFAALREKGDLKALLRHLRSRQQQQAPSAFTALHASYASSQGPQEEHADSDPVTALLRQQEQSVLASHGIDAPSTPVADARPRELKALRQVRAKQQSQRKRQRIEQAIHQTPSDAGPLNSHRLVSRALETLRDLSPAYLDHLVTQVDTLMWLEKLARQRRNF
ncbi:DUF2894 domain-containing protein [Alcanivorax sp.]|jgi:hypothetical protein|uniref:DUF2894 domain-containing protein n=1 Tax=Alcanivorax sp. TaxID=1872427 RepID=UPI0019B51173|nr:DUF2894 domain-containing protein [Alcanivorax sp.]MBD3645715.1 DUF2894 domain-containing protein [Alcanivorax sp.]